MHNLIKNEENSTDDSERNIHVIIQISLLYCSKIAYPSLSLASETKFFKLNSFLLSLHLQMEKQFLKTNFTNNSREKRSYL